MLIGIDGNEANQEKRVGVNQYAWELLKSMQKLISERENHQVIVYLKGPALPDMPKETYFWQYRVLPGEGAWIIRKLMFDLFFHSPKPDIFFTPSHYVPLFSPMPRVCTITDLGYLEFSGQFKKTDFWQLKYWSAYSINVSKAIIAISESTKRDIVRHYPQASSKIHVTLLGYDKDKYKNTISKEDVRRITRKYSIVNGVKGYVLFLSTLKPSKNVDGLLDAWSELSGIFPNLSLVIAGKKGWLYESIFKKVKNLSLGGSVIFTDYVSEEDKPLLISGAKAFVLPSFWEGFGLDALNAMACGVPVVVSKVGSLPEVVGDAGILVDPYNTSSIAQGVKKVLELGKRDYDALVRKSLIQAQKFSWEEAARQTLNVLEKNV